MVINLRNVLYKELNGKELLVFLFLSVSGIFVGAIFMTYYSFINYKLAPFTISLISFLIGVASGWYVEKKTKLQERRRQAY